MATRSQSKANAASRANAVPPAEAAPQVEATLQANAVPPAAETPVEMVAPPVEPVVEPSVETPAPPPTPVAAAKAKTAQLVEEGKYVEARKALDEVESLEKEADHAAKLAAAKARVAELMAEQKFAEAKTAMAEVDALESGPPKNRSRVVLEELRFRFKRLRPMPVAPVVEPDPAIEAVHESRDIVNLYSKIGAAVGLLPGGLLNFAAVLAVQVTMVWKISKSFNQTEGKERIRGSVLSLIGSAVPAGVGHSAGMAIAAIPAVIAGTVIYFLVTPVLAYAMTQAVGNAFIMHFESGGTLLTFDSKAFGEYFLKEFQKAGGVFTRKPVEEKPVDEKPAIDPEVIETPISDAAKA